MLAEYDGDRMLVAEAWVEPAERLARYVRPDEMQQAFNFDFLLAGWDAARTAAAIEDSLRAAATVGATTTWVLSNHDTVRHSTRFGLKDPTTFPKGIAAEDEQPDAGLGLARARAATMVSLALPGSAYLYQGEELGLPEHTAVPAEARQDPTFFRTNGVERGRDGCRVPLPWKSGEPGYGFASAAGARAGAPPTRRPLPGSPSPSRSVRWLRTGRTASPVPPWSCTVPHWLSAANTGWAPGASSGQMRTSPQTVSSPSTTGTSW